MILFQTDEVCNSVEAISLENDCSPTSESKPTKMSKAAKRRVSETGKEFIVDSSICKKIRGEKL